MRLIRLSSGTLIHDIESFTGVFTGIASGLHGHVAICWGGGGRRGTFPNSRSQILVAAPPCMLMSKPGG